MAERRRAQRGQSRLSIDRRATSPVVGKLLEMGLVVLFVGSLTTVLLGGVVPEYRTHAGGELGERVLASASQEVEAAVPPAAAAVDATRRVALPATIDGATYTVSTDGRVLVLDHSEPAVEARTRLVLPPRVSSVSGRWQSGTDTVVSVRDGPDGLVVELTETSEVEG
jgi:hypothetical protein